MNTFPNKLTSRSTWHAVPHHNKASCACRRWSRPRNSRRSRGAASENEIHAYRKDILREQVRNEQLTAILRKVEGEAKFLEGQNDTMRDKRRACRCGWGRGVREMCCGGAGEAERRHAQQAGVGTK